MFNINLAGHDKCRLDQLRQGVCVISILWFITRVIILMSQQIMRPEY